jgi:pyruvate/2-oxoglutarate dehydrogenase complex dihydrolipoamide acyltransferase (E2) component
MPFWYFFKIPKLPAEVSHQSNTVEVGEYLLEEGDPVKPGTPIATVENYWARMRLKANGKGILRRTFFRPSTTVKIGDPIAIIGADGDDIPYDKDYSLLEVVEIKRKKP